MSDTSVLHDDATSYANPPMIELTRSVVERIFAVAGIGEPIATIDIIPMPDYAVTTVAYVNRDFVLRCAGDGAETRFLRECRVLDQLSSHPFVPKILAIGAMPGRDDAHFQIQSRVPGDTLSSLWPNVSEDARIHWITELSQAVQAIQHHRLPAYRAGDYQSALTQEFPRWLDAHTACQQSLFDAAFARGPADWEDHLLTRARRFCDDHRSALEFESGPRLGHGDLHPMNVLGTPSGMTGIIDWEWSLPGGVEPEYDLNVLIRWALYPADFGDDTIDSPLTSEMVSCVIPTLLETFPELRSIPRLATRMTIYQIEHELHQIVSWPPAIPRQPLVRLSAWVDDVRLDDMLPNS